MSSKRIFIGITNTAGVGSRLKHGFDRIGVESNFYSFDKHLFSYETDKILKYSKNTLVRKFQKAVLLIKLIIKYDYFIYVHPDSLLKDFKDVKFLKFLGKKTMIVFTGCDIRVPELVEKYEWNTCSACTKEYQDYVNCVVSKKLKYTEDIQSLFDLISCPLEAAGNIKGLFYPGYFPVDLEIFPKQRYINYEYHSPLRIVHAPTNETYKGSKYIYASVNKIKEKYDIDFKVIKNVSIGNFYKEIADADLVIDQMLLGSYGFVSIEAMAMCKPVITYMREDIIEKIGSFCPIINANAGNLFDVLEQIILNPGQLLEISRRGREYVEQYWEEKKVAKDYYNLFLDLDK